MRPDRDILLLLCLLTCLPDLASATYEVGPEQALTSIGEVPWTGLQPGDRVRIHHRSEPYREKWVINRRGTGSAPIVVQGVPDATGALPVIDGADAVTVPGVDFWSEGRGVIKIGGASIPSEATPAWIVVEGLQVRNGDGAFAFIDDHSTSAAYSDNAAGIYIEAGEHIVIRGCVLTGNGNGLFCAHATRDLLVEACDIHGNGVVDSIYEHNSYTEAVGITFRANRFGPLREGARGNNLKDRSAGLVVQYNWIDGGNRCLDLVDGGHGQHELASYRDTWVVGNILIERDGGNNQILHYGGDSGDTSRYRKGLLHLLHNTIFSLRAGSTTLLRLSSADETCEAANNVVHASAGGSSLALLDRAGALHLSDNWFTAGVKDSHGSLEGSITIASLGERGGDPRWRDQASLDLHLRADSANVDAGSVLPDLILDRQYRLHRQTEARFDGGAPDRGAFAWTGTAPRITAIAANPATVSGTTGLVQATAEDDGGEAALTYTWSTQSAPAGVADPVFVPNGANGAKQATVSFARAGSYILRLTVTDADGEQAQATLPIEVEQVAEGLLISP